MTKNNIHPTAIVSSNSDIGEGVSIGPYSIIEGDTKISDNTKIDSYVQIKEYTTIGEYCQIFSNSVLGEIPQDKKFNNEISKLKIGNNTIIREFCTLNRGTSETGITVVGNNCLLMAYVHVGHDSIINDDVILANAVQLGGHVIIDDFSTIGGMTPVHQFCRIGKYAFIGGGLRVVQDVPPYILANGEPLKFCGINIIGLRRRRFSAKQREDIKSIYKIIYNSDLNISQAITEISKNYSSGESETIISFVKSSTRGLI